MKNATDYATAANSTASTPEDYEDQLAATRTEMEREAEERGLTSDMEGFELEEDYEGIDTDAFSHISEAYEDHLAFEADPDNWD